jgi:hypothetical protein
MRPGATGKLPQIRHNSTLAHTHNNLREGKDGVRRIRMSIYFRIVLILIFLVVAGALIFLVTWDVPPPLDPINKVVPDARFP